MISHTTVRFRQIFASLPKAVQRQANEAYARFSKDPYHPSLYFKRIHSARAIYSVRITRDYRAVGIQQNNEMIWFWIGNHSDYDKLLKKMKAP
jgi:hypothetical protein